MGVKAYIGYPTLGGFFKIRYDLRWVGGSDAPEPRLGSVLARAFKKKAWLGLLNILKSSVSKIYQKRAYFPFLLKNKFEYLGFFTDIS